MLPVCFQSPEKVGGRQGDRKGIETPHEGSARRTEYGVDEKWQSRGKQVMEAYVYRQKQRVEALQILPVRCWPVVNPVNHRALPSITSLSSLLLIYFSIDRCLPVTRVTFARWY